MSLPAWAAATTIGRVPVVGGRDADGVDVVAGEQLAEIAIAADASIRARRTFGGVTVLDLLLGRRETAVPGVLVAVLPASTSHSATICTSGWPRKVSMFTVPRPPKPMQPIVIRSLAAGRSAPPSAGR